MVGICAPELIDWSLREGKKNGAEKRRGPTLDKRDIFLRLFAVLMRRIHVGVVLTLSVLFATCVLGAPTLRTFTSSALTPEWTAFELEGAMVACESAGQFFLDTAKVGMGGLNFGFDPAVASSADTLLFTNAVLLIGSLEDFDGKTLNVRSAKVEPSEVVLPFADDYYCVGGLTGLDPGSGAFARSDPLANGGAGPVPFTGSPLHQLFQELYDAGDIFLPGGEERVVLRIDSSDGNEEPFPTIVVNPELGAYSLILQAYDVCTGFSPPPNGQVTGPNGITGSTTAAPVDDTLTISCNSGYQPVGGVTTTTCQAGSGFTSVGCEPVAAPSPPPPSPPPPSPPPPLSLLGPPPPQDLITTCVEQCSAPYIAVIAE